jgi:SAM-dependent methyltransferase
MDSLASQKLKKNYRILKIMSNNDQTPEKAQWVYDASNMEELSERYDQWAQDYDCDMINVFGSVGAQRTVEVFIKYVPVDVKILDVGAGTGIVGELLHQHGYRNFDGLDISLKMMEVARRKNVYRSLYQEVLGQPLSLTTDTYQAIIAKGVFAPGHAPSSAFNELIRITAPGGIIVFTLRSDYYETSDFGETQKDLEASGHWNLLEKTDSFAMWPKATEKLFYNVWIYEVTKP